MKLEIPAARSRREDELIDRIEKLHQTSYIRRLDKSSFWRCSRIHSFKELAVNPIDIKSSTESPAKILPRPSTQRPATHPLVGNKIRKNHVANQYNFGFRRSVEPRDIASIRNPPESRFIKKTLLEPGDKHSPLESSIVIQWNEQALEAIRTGNPVPTVITRSLHLVHAAMYDAWAAYDESAAGAYFNPHKRHALHRRTTAEALVEQAVSSAAFHILIELFPSHTCNFEALLKDLGHNFCSPGYQLGREAAFTVLSARKNDGSNAHNNFADTTDYMPVNHPDAAEIDPNHWTPLKIPTGTVVNDQGIPILTDNPDSFNLQSPLTPHWGSVQPFALKSGSMYRPVAPPQLGNDTPYEDALGVVSSNDAAYRRQFGEVAQLSADLTDRQKVIAEYWADGPKSSTPPGHWNEIAQDLATREQLSLEDDVKLFFALNNALFDTSIAIWDAKYTYDYVRPQTAIRHLYADQDLLAWGGPNQGTQRINGSNWQPYQDVTFVTPAFPEYVSGHSGFSFAAATVLEAFTGSDVFYDGITRGVQDFDGDGEADLIGTWSTNELGFETYNGDSITLQWLTLWDAAAEAGQSRLYGGIHIQDGDLRAREMGIKVANDAWSATTELFTAEIDALI